jgi:hypothetical protein
MGRGESLHDVRELCELKYVDEVNRYLDAGWIFVKAPVEEELFYVVGWPLAGSSPPITHHDGARGQHDRHGVRCRNLFGVMPLTVSAKTKHQRAVIFPCHSVRPTASTCDTILRARLQ